MPPTERLYYTDSYVTEFESRVVASSADGLRVTLDRTAFYPVSGGQPHDLGVLNNIPVLEVLDEGETITHILAAPLTGQTVTGQTVRGQIDWIRRYDHMQQHTGQHLLSAVFEQLFDFATLSFHLGDKLSSIELGVRDLTQSQIDSVTLRASELARINPLIAIAFEDATHAQGLRKASAREGTLRIIEIPGIDRSACGGTHVAALAETLPIQIREIDKVRGNVRVSFACGNRAIARCQKDFQILTRIAKTLAAAPENAESHVAALQQRITEADKQRQRLETRAGVDLYKTTAPSEDGTRRVLLTEAIIDENARTKAKAFASQPKAVLLMHGGESLLLACSPDSGINAGAILKRYLARGGGSATLAQGNLSDNSVLEKLMQAVGLSA